MDLKPNVSNVCVGNVQVPVLIIVLGKAKFALTLQVEQS